MKKIILSIAVVALISSCSKQRTCTCERSNPQTGTSETFVRVYPDSKKRMAKINCNGMERVEDGFDPKTGQIPIDPKTGEKKPTYYITTKCKLK